MTNARMIKHIYSSKATIEGAGVKLNRAFGYNEVPTFGPFLMLDDFGSANPKDYIAGFPWHPHRGIIHQEMPQLQKDYLRGLQLWVNLPAKHKMMKPRYQDIQASEIPTVIDKNKIEVKVIAGMKS